MLIKLFLYKKMVNVKLKLIKIYLVKKMAIFINLIKINDIYLYLFEDLNN
jgi:hypothetical protein